MSASIQQMSVAEFIAWEDEQPDKHEFDGIWIRSMTGGTDAHAAVQRNVIVALGFRLRGQRCRVFGSELKIVVSGSVRYPDAFVTCARGSLTATVADDPVVVFEVLSRSSVQIDRIDKMREYQLTQSIKRYVILEQTRAMATIFSRDNGAWLAEIRYGSETLEMPEIGLSVPIAEFYLDLDVPAGPDTKTPPSEESGAF